MKIGFFLFQIDVQLWNVVRGVPWEKAKESDHCGKLQGHLYPQNTGGTWVFAFTAAVLGLCTARERDAIFQMSNVSLREES